MQTHYPVEIKIKDVWETIKNHKEMKEDLKEM